MRLWHENLIPYLPNAQLLGQHRECCALRGNGWGRKHATVNYVFDHSPAYLVAFHLLVMQEMRNRRYKIDPLWYDHLYRGKICSPWEKLDFDHALLENTPIYPEHNDYYLAECLDNLAGKGVIIDIKLAC